MTNEFRHHILSSLASVLDDAECQVAKLDRFQALKAIEKTIEDFQGLDDVTSGLSDLRDRVTLTLDRTREVRALRTVERILPELSEVLAYLTERSALEASESEGAHADDVRTPVEPVGAIDAVVDIAVSDPVVDSAVTHGEESSPQQSDSIFRAEERSTDASSIEDPAKPSSGEIAPAPFSSLVRHAEVEASPSLAYSLAQMMVQSMVPPGQVLGPPTPPDAEARAAAEPLNSQAEADASERAA